MLQFGVAKELGLSLGQVRSMMTAEELLGWSAYFQILNEDQQKETISGLTRYRCFRPRIDDLRVWNLSRQRLYATGFFNERAVPHEGECARFRSQGFD